MRTWLSPAGAATAALVGTAVLAGTGWRGLALLFLFLASSSALTPGGGRRRPIQVLANGGVAAACALLAPLWPEAGAAFAGALAAATADTWSTEIGMRSRVQPRSIATFAPVERGASGGVTMLGTLGGAGGAVTIALAALLLGSVPPGDAVAVGVAGIAGTLADSLLGATVQDRRGWLNNDTVNLACTMVGAAVAALPRLLAPG